MSNANSIVKKNREKWDKSEEKIFSIKEGKNSIYHDNVKIEFDKKDLDFSKTDKKDQISFNRVKINFDKNKFALLNDIFSFNPSGLKFKKPIQITIPYESKIVRPFEKNLIVFEYIEDIGWIKTKKVSQDLNQKTITFETNHFSEYAVGQGSFSVDESGTMSDIPVYFDTDPYMGSLIINRTDANVSARGLDLKLTSNFNSDYAYNSFILRKPNYPEETIKPAGGMDVPAARSFYRIARGWQFNLPSVNWGPAFTWGINFPNGDYYDLRKQLTGYDFGSNVWKEEENYRFKSETVVNNKSNYTFYIYKHQVTVKGQVEDKGGGNYYIIPQTVKLYLSEGSYFTFNNNGLVSQMIDPSSKNSLTYTYMNGYGAIVDTIGVENNISSTTSIISGTMLSRKSDQSPIWSIIDSIHISPNGIPINQTESPCVIWKVRLDKITHSDGRSIKFYYLTDETPDPDELKILLLLSSDGTDREFHEGDKFLGLYTLSGSNEDSFLKKYETLNTLFEYSDVNFDTRDYDYLIDDQHKYFEVLQKVEYVYDLHSVPDNDTIKIYNNGNSEIIYTFNKGCYSCNHEDVDSPPIFFRVWAYLNKPKVTSIEIKENTNITEWLKTEYKYYNWWEDADHQLFINDYSLHNSELLTSAGPSNLSYIPNNTEIKNIRKTSSTSIYLTKKLLEFEHDNNYLSIYKGIQKEVNFISRNGGDEWDGLDSVHKDFVKTNSNLYNWNISSIRNYSYVYNADNDLNYSTRKDFSYDTWNRCIKTTYYDKEDQIGSSYTQYIGSPSGYEDYYNKFANNPYSSNYSSLFDNHYCLLKVGAIRKENNYDNDEDSINYSGYDSYLNLVSTRTVDHTTLEGKEIIVDNLDYSNKFRNLDSTYTYDNETNNITSITKPMGNSISVIHGTGWKSSYIVEDNQELSDNLDSAGHEHIINTFDYDIMGRLIKKESYMTQDDGTTLYSSDYPKMTLKYSYDGMSRMLSKSSIADSTETFLLKQVYDDTNRVVQTTDSLGFRTKTYYDQLYRPTSVEKWKPNIANAGIDWVDGYGGVSAYLIGKSSTTYDQVFNKPVDQKLFTVPNSRTTIDSGTYALTHFHYDEQGRVVDTYYTNIINGSGTERHLSNTIYRDSKFYTINKVYEDDSSFIVTKRVMDQLGRGIKKSYSFASKNPPAQELMNNGNCESTTSPTIFNYTSGYSNGITFSRSNEMSRSGSYSYKATSSGSSKYYFHSDDSTSLHGFNVSKIYLIKGWIYIPSTNGPDLSGGGVFFETTIDGSTWSDYLCSLTTELDTWQYFEKYVSIKENDIGCRVGVRFIPGKYVSGDSFYVDDLSFTEEYETDALITTNTYDCSGRLVEVQLPNGTNNLGETYSYIYSSTGSIEKITYPDGTMIINNYNKNGSLVANFDRRGVTFTYNYNDKDLVTSQIAHGTPDTTISQNYCHFGIANSDKIEGLTTIVINSNKYNTLGSITEFSQTIDSKTIKVQNIYNAAGIQTGVTAIGSGTSPWSKTLYLNPQWHPASDVYNYNFSTISPNSDGSSPIFKNVSRFDGNLESIEYGSGETISFTYDEFMRLASIDNTDAGITDMTFGRNFLGNILVKNDNLTSENNYTYDGMNRLYTESLGSKTYAYDKLSNLNTVGTKTWTYELTDSDTKNATYKNQMRLKRFQDTSDSTDWNITYDVNGNIARVSDRFKKMSYDAFNRLKEIEYFDGNKDKYYYNVSGMRIKKEEYARSGNAQTIYYLYSGEQILIKETYEGSVLKETMFNILSGTATLGSYIKTYNPSGEVLKYYYVDNLGSRTTITDSSGTVENQFTYSTWGEVS